MNDINVEKDKINLVVERIKNNVPNNFNIRIIKPNGEVEVLNKKNLIDNIKNQTVVGKRFVESYMLYLQSFKKGENRFKFLKEKIKGEVLNET